MTFPDQSFSTPESQPPEPVPVSRARRRRARRTFFPKDAEGRATLLASLARRAYPSYELFIYSILCGAVLGLGFLLDSQALLLLGILFAPLMAPWVGLALATISGTPRLFFQTLAGLCISILLVFGAGLLAGLASRLFQPLTLTQAFTHSRLWIPDLVVLAFGAILLTASFVRSEEKPYLPSIIVAYEFFLPLNAAGFGLGSTVGDIWPHGMLVFVVHLAWATVFGLLTLAVLRFHPSTSSGYLFGLTVFIVAALSVFWLTGAGKLRTVSAPVPTSPSASVAVAPPPSGTTPPTTYPIGTPVLLRPTEARSTPGNAPEVSATPETITPVPLTLNVTLLPTTTRTSTLSPEPTPIYALIHAQEGGGAYIRKEPGGNILATLDNGSIVEVLSETQEVNGALWIHVVATRNGIRVEGWIIQSVLETATPVPNWEPTETPIP